METASVSNIRKALGAVPPEVMQQMLLRLCRYKKENKELLSYLLFESDDETGYIKQVKEEIDLQFLGLNHGSYYLAKKTIRKVLRTTNKYIRYSGKKETEIELLLYFCQKLKNSKLNYKGNRTVFNLYLNQVKRIQKAIEKVHEDLQYDYQEELENL